MNERTPTAHVTGQAAETHGQGHESEAVDHTAAIAEIVNDGHEQGLSDEEIEACVEDYEAAYGVLSDDADGEATDAELSDVGSVLEDTVRNGDIEAKDLLTDQAGATTELIKAEHEGSGAFDRLEQSLEQLTQDVEKLQASLQELGVAFKEMFERMQKMLESLTELASELNALDEERQKASTPEDREAITQTMQGKIDAWAREWQVEAWTAGESTPDQKQ